MLRIRDKYGQARQFSTKPQNVHEANRMGKRVVAMCMEACWV